MEEALREEELETIDAPAAPAPEAPPERLSKDVDTPTPPPTSSSEDPLDQLLREFDEGIARTEPAPTNGAASPQQDELESLLSQLGEQQRQASEQAATNAIEQGQLQSQRDGWQQSALYANQALQEVQAYLQRENDLKDFERIANDIQVKLPSHLPPDYAKLKLMDVGKNDLAAQIAFDNRYKSPMLLNAQLQQAQSLLVQAQMRGLSDRVPQLQQQVEYLAIAVQSQQIIHDLKARVINEARAVKQPIDEDMTADLAMVAQAVKTAGAKMPAERAPYLGNMSDQELKNYTRQWGF